MMVLQNPENLHVTRTDSNFVVDRIDVMLEPGTGTPAEIKTGLHSALRIAFLGKNVIFNCEMRFMVVEIIYCFRKIVFPVLKGTKIRNKEDSIS